MSLDTYDATLALPAFGLRNSGAICYFNSMLQCFVGCTSVLRAFERVPDLQTRNDLCTAVWRMIEGARAGKPVSQFSTVIWTAFIRMLKELKMEHSEKVVGTALGDGMECANEGFVKFLEAFDAPEILELFQHRYKTIMHCTACNVTRETQNNAGETIYDENVFCEFSIAEFQADGSLQNMIFRRTTAQEVDDYRCSSCGNRTKHLRTERLTFTPEVIVTLFKKQKYDEKRGRAVYDKWAADAPAQLTIPGRTSPITYRLIGLNEHSGNMEGGHYWAHTLRRTKPNGPVSMWRLNDMSTAEAPDAGCTVSTYMAWYHAA